MAQYGALQAQLQTLESEAESLQKQREEASAARDRVTRDHEHLLAVHERQAAEYEQLMTRHAELKGNQRALEQEHRALESKSVPFQLSQSSKYAFVCHPALLQKKNDAIIPICEIYCISPTALKGKVHPKMKILLLLTLMSFSSKISSFCILKMNEGLTDLERH